MRPASVFLKRIDLAGEAPAETLKLNNGTVSVLPGRYLVSLAPSAVHTCRWISRLPRRKAGSGAR